jgi:branched-chain amino acid transport system ATP-binding protein
MPEPLLAVRALDAFYGDFQALFGVSLEVAAGEVVAVIGANGAGKSTLLKSIAGLMPARREAITFAGEPIGDEPAHAVVARGIALVPEGRRLFPRLTVEENLMLGAFRPTARAQLKRNLDFCLETFPRLRERARQLAGSLSGGEQQMLALARALMLAPKILLIDEPSVGLAPILVSRTIDTIQALKESYQLTVLMAEQNFTQAIRISNRGYVIVHGKIIFEGRSADELNNNDLIRKFYLGL